MSTSPEEPHGKKGNSDLSYHLHRLLDSTESDASSRLRSAKGIQANIREAIASVSDDLLPKFLQLHDQTVDQSLWAEVAEILAFRWATTNEVQLLINAALDSKETPLGTIRRWVETLGSRLGKSPELSQDAGIRMIVANAHLLLARYNSEQEEDLTIRAMNLLQRWICASYAHDHEMDINGLGIKGIAVEYPDRHLIVDEEAKQYLQMLLDGKRTQQWISKLRSFYERNREKKRGWGRVQSDRARAFLKFLGEECADDQDEQSGRSFDFFAFLSRALEEKDHTLSPEEEQIFAEYIQKQGLSPAEFLTEILREKSYVFLETGQTRRLPSLVAYLEKEAHLTHVALDISPEYEHQFRAFLEGDDPPKQIFADEEKIEECREWLKRIDQLPGVEWCFVGCSPSVNRRGEIALDQQVHRLATIRKINSSARVLILHCANTCFCWDVTKKGLTDIHEGKHVSIAEALAEAVGKDRVASVKTLDENNRFDGDDGAEDGEVGEFCSDHGILTSFGVRPEKTPLKDKPFETDYKDLYADGWDGLLVLLSDDRDHEEPVDDAPDPSLGKTRSPSGVLV